MSQSFIKMNGLGNDFVIFDQRTKPFAFDESFLRLVADRKRGIGCDQVIMIEPSTKADVFMRIFNPDASQAEACGNATRCVGSLIMSEMNCDKATIETVVGVLPVARVGADMISADMGTPRLLWNEIPLAFDSDTLSVNVSKGNLVFPCCVNMGNPHAVFFVSDVANVDLAHLGPQLETHTIFPRKANIEIAQILSPTRIRMRVWERGAGITEACGSAACATLVAAVRRHLSERKAEIIMDGGSLMIEWRETDQHVVITGTASLSFHGAI